MLLDLLKKRRSIRNFTGEDISFLQLGYLILMLKKVSELLKLPRNCIASEILAFGYPANKKEPVKKKN